MKKTYKRPDDIRDVLPPEYVSRFLDLGYDPSALDEIFNISVYQAEKAHKEEKILDYYRMNIIFDIEESEKLIAEDK
ncbi:hypothetical protein IJ380_04015 [Candidatus Saccharibacteria bacterium]|nr:hypothetical protein [Candidatus Saccharibacteria bacterium]